MSLLNAFAGRLLDLWLQPFGHLPPIVGLAVISIVTAIGVLLVFRATSDQRRLRAVRRQLQAAVFEIRLFHDDVRAVFRALGETLRHQAAYLRLTILPGVCTIVLLAPVVSHLQSVYGYEAMQPGRPVLLTAGLRDGFGPPAWGEQGVRLEAPGGIDVQTPAVWIPATREVIWRLAPEVPGEYVLHIVAGGVRMSKTLDAVHSAARRSPVRPERGVLNQLRHPAEPPLPEDGPLTALRLAYPERRLDVLGWRVHWIVVYVVLVMLAALALRTRLRVTL